MMVGGNLRTVVLPADGSDHFTITLEWENAGVHPQKPFWFEKVCLLYPYFQEKLKYWWENSPPIRGTRMYQFQQKLKHLKEHIKKWNKDSFGNIFQEKWVLETKIQHLQSQVILNGYTEDPRLQEKTLLQEFNQRERQEEAYWSQNPISSGSKKGNVTPAFSIKRPFNTGRATDWTDWRRRMGALLKPKRIWRTLLTITLLTSCRNRREIGRKLKERFLDTFPNLSWRTTTKCLEKLSRCQK